MHGKAGNNDRPPMLILVGLIIAVLSAAPVEPAVAQGGDPAIGKLVWINKANCKDCHGWGGHGVPDVPQEPNGANLRRTELTGEQLAEVVRCGRPASSMPYFLSNAWREGRTDCYGMSRADVGQDLPLRSPVTLAQREIDAIVAFILAEFVGKDQPTYEECIEFWGPTTRCDEYPRAGG